MASLMTCSCLAQESVMVVILSMLASVSGEITTGTLLISPPDSSSAMDFAHHEQDPVPRRLRNEASFPK